MTIDAVDTLGAVDQILLWCRQPGQSPCRYIVTPNVDHVVMHQTHTGLREAYAGAALVLADGAPVVAAARWLHQPLPERVAGSDLVPALFDETDVRQEDKLLRVFLLGAAPGVGDRAAQRIHSRWSKVNVVGSYAPPFGFEHDDAENERIVQAVADAKPDLLLIGLGAPKQELWIHRHSSRLSAPVALCVGATLDFLAGEKHRSPLWMRRVGLEWLHRLACEPSRLAHRYLRDACLFPQIVWREWRKQGIS